MSDIIMDNYSRIKNVGFQVGKQSFTFIENCNICGSNKFVEICQRDRYGFPNKAYGCLECGLVFLNPRMDNENYSLFYKDFYRKLVSAYHGREINATTIQEEQKVYAMQLSEFISSFFPDKNKKTLLDIGGSTGIISYHLNKMFKFDPIIIDPSPDEIMLAKKYGFNTFTGLLEEFDQHEKTFDLILLCQTIDHLIDVKGSLSKISSLMDDNSLLFFDIVDFRAAYLRNWEIEEAIKIDHPYYFTVNSIDVILKRTGFEIIRTQFSSDKLHIGFLCKKCLPDPNFLPINHDLNSFWKEIRYVQNTSHFKKLREL